MLQSQLLTDNVQFTPANTLLLLNSAADPLATCALQRLRSGTLLLAEDNVAMLEKLAAETRPVSAAPAPRVRCVAFHDYIVHHAPTNVDVAAMNLYYQPGNAWMLYGLHVAAYALREGGRLYVAGAKDRGILTIAKRMNEYFGNVETLEISKGHRVVCARKDGPIALSEADTTLPVFARGKLDEGTRLLLEALEVHVTDEALDLGCGSGVLGLHIARLATKGQVTMVDVSLAAVAAAQQAIERSGLTNIRVLPSDATQAVRGQRFDLIVTNPPFHLGGEHTTHTAERFIQESAPLLTPRGRFYLVANRFLKYEPTLRVHFQSVEEVAGNSRYKVLRAHNSRV
jgi:16S rRNA (guanine1207-N2)-methyltransferase